MKKAFNNSITRLSKSTAFSLSSSAFILGLLFSVELVAQVNLRAWEAGDLTWDDFKGKALNSSDSNSEFAYTLSYASHKEKFGDTTLFFLKTENQINQNITWAKESERSDQLLDTIRYCLTLLRYTEESFR